MDFSRAVHSGGEVQLTLDGRKRDVDDAEVELKDELGSDYETKGQTQARDRRCAGVSGLMRGGGARCVGYDLPCRSG